MNKTRITKKTRIRQTQVQKKQDAKYLDIMSSNKRVIKSKKSEKPERSNI